MSHPLYAAALGLFSVAMPLRAANRPHARSGGQNPVVWTNDGLERLHALGPISIVGRVVEETATPASAPEPCLNPQDPDWYAEEAATLGDELEGRQAQLRGYRQALEDAQSLRRTTGNFNPDAGSLGITPGASIEILQQRVNETQGELDALDDLARRHGIAPGTLRGE
jgi:hypothetical protein